MMRLRFDRDFKRDALFLTVLSVVVASVGASSIIEKSVTWDEPFYIGMGYFLIKTNKFWVEETVAHPPLSFYVSSIPFYVLDLSGNLPDQGVLLKSTRNCFFCKVWDNYRFIYGDAYRKYNLLFYSRCSMLILLVLCSVYLFKFSKELFGFETAATVTTLFALNPNIIAHASLATTDITPVCFNLISFYYFTRFMENKTPLNGVKAGVSLGLALLSKSSSLYLLIVYAAIIAAETVKRILSRDVRLDKTRLARSIAACLVAALFAVATVDAGYFFRGVPADLSKESWSEATPQMMALKKLFGGIPLPISKYYLLMEAATGYHTQIGHEIYFRGEAKNETVWTTPAKANKSSSWKETLSSAIFNLRYWATTVLIKTPEGILLILLISAAYYSNGIIMRRGLMGGRTPRVRFYTLVNLLVFGLILARLNVLIGIRLVLLVFPFIYLLMGEPIKFLYSGSAGARAIVYLLTVLSILPTAVYHPHYIAYFNQFIGGPENGYKYLSDSNIDWGQDLPGLKRYMDENNIEVVKLAYFGRAMIEEHGINYISLPNNQRHLPIQRRPDVGCGPTTGVLAVSVTSITGQYGNPECYRWLEKFRPVDSIGYSILVYKITRKDLKNAGLPLKAPKSNKPSGVYVTPA